MTLLQLELHGALRDHPSAGAFAAEVARVHRRYATEVVAANQLCPFLRDPETAFGRFCVMLDPALDLDAARAAVTAGGSLVVHVVYPCVRPAAPVFEKFAARLGEAVRAAVADPPVLATFHPDLTGDPSTAHRMVGLLRRAPDPFVQFIPAGLHEGGTVFAGTSVAPTADNASVVYGRLKGAPLEALLARLAEVHEDRDRSYAPFLRALA
jgi:hypothetical protein